MQIELAGPNAEHVPRRARSNAVAAAFSTGEHRTRRLRGLAADLAATQTKRGEMTRLTVLLVIAAVLVVAPLAGATSPGRDGRIAYMSKDRAGH